MKTPAPSGTEGSGRDQQTAATTTTADRNVTATASSVLAQQRTGRGAAVSWSKRHRARLDRAFGVRDPWIHEPLDDWTAAEIDAWQAAAGHLTSHGLYSRWQVPESVRASWRRLACRHCSRGGDAA